MKKLLCLFTLVVVLFASACGKAEEESNTQLLEAGKIYFFYSNGCPHCHDALEYINKKYLDLKMTMVNVENPAGYELLFDCAEKFKLGSRVGTPLFCMDDKHLMGWAPEYEKQFDELVKPYLK